MVKRNLTLKKNFSKLLVVIMITKFESIQIRIIHISYNHLSDNLGEKNQIVILLKRIKKK